MNLQKMSSFAFRLYKMIGNPLVIFSISEEINIAMRLHKLINILHTIIFLNALILIIQDDMSLNICNLGR